MSTIADALRSVRPPPCEHHGGCPSYGTCQRHKVACTAFAAYVSQSRNCGPVTRLCPTREIYDRIYAVDAD